MPVTLIVKGNRHEAHGAAHRRGIPSMVLREVPGPYTVLLAHEEDILAITCWLGEIIFPLPAPFPVGSLMTFAICPGVED